MTLITCGWLTPGRRFHVWDTPPRTEPPASTPCLCGAAVAPRAKDLPEPPAEPAPAAVKPPPVIRVPVPDGADAAQVLAGAAARIIVEPEPATPAADSPVNLGWGHTACSRCNHYPQRGIEPLPHLCYQCLTEVDGPQAQPVLGAVPHDGSAADVLADVAAADTAAAAGCHNEHPPAEPAGMEYLPATTTPDPRHEGQAGRAALFTGLDESPVSLPPEVRPEPTVITEGRIRGVSVDAVPGPAGGRVVTQAVDPAPEVTRTGSAVPVARERWFVLALDENEAQQWRDRQGEGGRHRDAYILLTDVHPDGQGGCAFLDQVAITPLDHIVRCRLNEQGVYYDEVITALHLAQERGKA